LYINAKDTITFIAIKIKDYYNSYYTLIYFKVGDLVYL